MALLLGRGASVSSLSCSVDPAGSGALGEKLCGQPPAEGVCHLLRPVGELAQGAGNDRHAGPRDLSGLESPIVRAAASEARPGTILLPSAKKCPLKWPLAHSWGNLGENRDRAGFCSIPLLSRCLQEAVPHHGACPQKECSFQLAGHAGSGSGVPHTEAVHSLQQLCQAWSSPCSSHWGLSES